MNWALSVMSTSSASNNSSGTEAEAQEIEDATGADQAGPMQKAQAFIEDVANRTNGYWGYVFLASMGIFAIFLICMGFFTVFRAFRKKRHEFTWEDKMLTCIWLFLLALIIMYCSKTLEIPRIMEPERIAMFIGYVSPVIMVFPFELLYLLLPGNSKIVANLCPLAASIGLFVASFFFGLSPTQTYFYMEHSLAAQACLIIDREFPNNTWTVVSPVEELTLVNGSGHHYELWEFVTNMERYQEDAEVEIPTEYVFFILEKKPLEYNQYRVDGLDYEFEPLDFTDAEGVVSAEMLGINENDYMGYYGSLEARRMLEAKLAAWLEEYSKAFPDQIEVFLEDDDIVVYKFTQDLALPNNFAIDYGYNVISDVEYYEQLRVKMVERGEDVSKIDEKLAELRSEAR